MDHWEKLASPDEYRDQANWVASNSVDSTSPATAWVRGHWMFTEYTVGGVPRYLLWHREDPNSGAHWLAYVDGGERVVFDKASEVRAFVADREAAAA